MMEKLLEQEAMMEEDQRVSHLFIPASPYLLLSYGKRLQCIRKTRR